VPTLDGSLLQITRAGAITPLVDLVAGQWGVPFGLAAQGNSLVATVSNFLGEHFLVRVAADGQVSKLANFEAVTEFYGSPFGVAARDRVIDHGRHDPDHWPDPWPDDYVVTLSSDTTAAQGVLLRVSAQGKISLIADLSEYGIPFGVIADQGDFIVAQHRGWLTRVTMRGQVSPIVDLGAMGLGVPFSVGRWQDQLVVTTNQGLVVQVGRNGQGARAIANLRDQKFGIPAGLVVDDRNSLIVSTTGGYLLRLTLG
jgi:hypothetical protein